MADFKRISLVLMTSAACAALAGCGGADGVASPGEGTIVVVTPTPTPTSAPTPTPTASPTPTPTASSGPAASCPTGTSDTGIVTSVNRRSCQLPSTVTGSVRLQNLPGVVYALSGRVNVGVDVGADGTAAGGASALLTVDPGVVIYGNSGADFLVVNRGSQIFAEGTNTAPVIMTSRANIDGSSGAESQGQWGGLVILGRGPISNCNSAQAGTGTNTTGLVNSATTCQNQIEGTTNALYGGGAAADNSGRLRYLQVRYAGFELAPNNELNGITWGAVGSGTVADHLQVHNSSDDGMEWFGGRISMKYVVLSGNDDDNLDTDFGYKGFLQYVLVMQRPSGNSGDSIIEADSADGGEQFLPRQQTILSNFTFIHRSNLAASINAMLLRGGTDYTMVNGIVSSTRTCLDIDGTVTVQAADNNRDEAGAPVFNSVAMQCATAAFQNDADVDGATAAAAFNAGANNSSTFTTSLVAPAGGYAAFINGANETARAPFDAGTLDNFTNVLSGTTLLRVGSPNTTFFDTTSYVGAVRDANDTWWRDWTCGISSATPACTTVPFNTAS